ncbi:SAM-dependent methyltransferase [Bacillus lacus]|uniref:SAM-dependent methyltransferase n=1 Tax=Metabacillus lacus TaxID=1983721 RepID=A0A7X2IZT3_9BACI|nr:SAM-dependent methyltransferase [Metabacillus lacus]MRX72492.1 SAM-dependent methyltransferase [Metabacillus lacus]
MKEREYEQLLNIHTEGFQQGFPQSLHYHRYEPTPYWVLKFLIEFFEFNEGDHLVDFGCGKGRLGFFVHYFTGAGTTGIEMEEHYFIEAEDNLETYRGRNSGKNALEFYCCLAQDYKVKELENIFYFFNPFSVKILMKVINNILISAEQHSRDIYALFYYPSEDYIFFLENKTPFQLEREITLGSHPGERILIYKLSHL